MVTWGERFAEVIEIDIDRCTRTYGVGACTAALGGNNTHKCYNSFTTCQVQSAYNKGINTLKFISATFPVKNGGYLPLLESVSGYEQTVNLNGFEDSLLGIGKRASVDIKMRDMPYNDTLTDKYWLERMNGTAQLDGGGYRPVDRGSFWGKFKARNPNFTGRTVRHILGYVTAAGEFVGVETRVYVMEDISSPSSSGVTIKVKDVLSLADNKKAKAPVTSTGSLLADIEVDASSAALTTNGAGYPSSGYACIGSEIVGFSRSGSNLTLTQRGAMGTVPSQHAAGDVVQLCYYTGDRTRIDSVIRDLLVNYGNIPASYIDWVNWQAECNVWGRRYVLTGIIPKPEDVIKLLGEICLCFGVSLWWDAAAQKIRLKLNHAILEDPIFEWNDRNNIIKGGISVQTNDSDRITRVEMNTVQRDPTRGIGEDNFTRSAFDVYGTGELPEMFGISRTETINNRWLNHGDDSFAFILTGRLLTRYKRAPTVFTVDIDNKDLPPLVEVVGLTSHAVQDITGLPQRALTQVYNIKPKKAGTTSTVTMQEFLFTAKYARFAPSGTPVYTSASEYQRNRYMFWSNPAGFMSNGDQGFRWA